MLSRATPAAPRRRLTATAVAGAVLLLVGFAGASRAPRAADRADAAAAAARASLSVTSTQVRTQDWPVTVSASGTVAAWMEASIGARVTGLPLVEVLVNVGDRVRKGQMLARFDDVTVRSELDQLAAALAQAEAAVRQAEAGAAQANANRDRALAIQDSGAISEQDVLQYTTLAATAQAQLAQAHAQVAQVTAQRTSTQLKLEFTRVTAPDDGVISARGATVGSVIQAAGSGSELFRLIRKGRLEWRAELTASQLALVKPGTMVTLALPDGRSVAGRVRQLGPTLDPNTRLGIAYVDLGTDSHLLASMYLSGTLQFARRAALTVPAESVVIRDGRSYVLRLEGARARLSAVTVGRRQGSDIEVTSGVHNGEQVVVRGAGFLNDNELVQVVERATP